MPDSSGSQPEVSQSAKDSSTDPGPRTNVQSNDQNTEGGTENNMQDLGPRSFDAGGNGKAYTAAAFPSTVSVCTQSILHIGIARIKDFALGGKLTGLEQGLEIQVSCRVEVKACPDTRFTRDDSMDESN